MTFHQFNLKESKEVQKKLNTAYDLFEEEFGEKKTAVDIHFTGEIGVHVFHTVDFWDEDGTRYVEREIVTSIEDRWWIGVDVKISDDNARVKSDGGFVDDNGHPYTLGKSDPDSPK